MAYLTYRHTPPHSDSKAFLITPAEFFQSPAVMESTKKKAQSDDLGPESTKRFQFDPSPEEEDKIVVSDYCRRVYEQLPSDRERIFVKVSFDEQVERLDEHKVYFIIYLYQLILIDTLGLNTCERKSSERYERS